MLYVSYLLYPILCGIRLSIELVSLCFIFFAQKGKTNCRVIWECRQNVLMQMTLPYINLYKSLPTIYPDTYSTKQILPQENFIIFILKQTVFRLPRVQFTSHKIFWIVVSRYTRRAAAAASSVPLIYCQLVKR